MNKDNYFPKILVIEDNAGDFALIEDYLDEQFQLPAITQAKNFDSARSLLADLPIEFDVVLLDLSLPDKSGEKLITDISSLCHNCPIIVLTGYADIEFSIKSLSLGIADYLVKDDITPAMLHKSILYNIERKKTNVRLQESEKRFSNLFNLSPQPMWLYDPETLKFLQVNQAAVSQYGYSEKEFYGLTILDIRPPEEIGKVQLTLKELNHDQLTVFSGRFRHFKKNKEIILVDIYSSDITMNDKTYRSVIAIDVTEKVSFENNLTKAILKTQEDERYEIGGELHDNVCQILATSQLTLSMMKDSITPSSQQHFDQVKKYITLASDEIRNLSHRLAPAFFNDSTLEDSFRMLLKDFNMEDRYEVNLYFHAAVKDIELAGEIQLNLYRILQEQLRNIDKYAQARSIEIDVMVHQNNLKMWVADDGIGFDIKKAKNGIGISNMRRRTELFSGRFEINSSPGQGCELAVYIPLNA